MFFGVFSRARRSNYTPSCSVISTALLAFLQGERKPYLTTAKPRTAAAQECASIGAQVLVSIHSGGDIRWSSDVCNVGAIHSSETNFLRSIMRQSTRIALFEVFTVFKNVTKPACTGDPPPLLRTHCSRVLRLSRCYKVLGAPWGRLASSCLRRLCTARCRR